MKKITTPLYRRFTLAFAAFTACGAMAASFAAPVRADDGKKKIIIIVGPVTKTPSTPKK